MHYCGRKNRGNDFYRDKNYQAAVGAYTKAIALDSENPSLFTNRSAALLMLLQYREAMQDCDQALALDPTNSKAYFRKATACKGNVDECHCCFGFKVV